MGDKWKVIHNTRDIVSPGIFQEKYVVIATDTAEANQLKQAAADKGAEFCEPPKQITERYPQAFAVWINKHDPKCSAEDIRMGNIRMKIN